MHNDLKNILESLLFVADSPIDIRTFKQIIPDAEAKEIREALNELITEHEARQGGFLLNEVAGGFQFRTRPDYKEWIKKMLKPAPVRLSKAALETLAIIAYHQPIIRADVERIRGVDSGAIIRNLLERKLIRILGKKEIPGRPLIYATTRKFLEIFNLKSLSDMPTLKEIQEFGQVGIAEEVAAGHEDQPDQSGDAQPDDDTTAADQPDGNGPEPETAVSSEQGERQDITEAADGTFARQLGVEIPKDDETGFEAPGPEADAQTDESDLAPSATETTESADEPAVEDQEMDLPQDDDAVDPDQDEDQPESDDAADEAAEEEPEEH